MVGHLSHVIRIGAAASLLATGLSACGVIPSVAQQTTAAAIAPFTTAAQYTNATLQTLGRGMTAMTAQTQLATRQLQIANANAAAYRPVVPQPVSYSPAPRTSSSSSSSSSRSSSSDKTDSSKTSTKPTLDILPQETLKRLTKDQAGLQRAAQGEAMTAAVGETIFWHIEGREGTALAERESPMGSFTCRTFVQTIALEDYFDTATLTACRNDSGAWIQSF